MVRYVTWDFSTIEPHLYKVGHGVFGYKRCVELPVASVLYTAGDGTIVHHDLQVSRSGVGCVNCAVIVSDKAGPLFIRFNIQAYL